MDLDNDTLIASILSQLKRHFPQWPPPSHTLVIREKRATFSCHTGIRTFRPATRTPVPGLWLAGDYTDTGLPATWKAPCAAVSTAPGKFFHLGRRNEPATYAVSNCTANIS